MPASNSDAAPRTIPARQRQQLEEMDETMAQSFDSFSRSVPGTMPFLEAEPAPIVLPRDPAAVTTTGAATRRAYDSDGEDGASRSFPRNDHDRKDAEEEPTETSPLLSDAAPEQAADAAPPPFLNGVSPARFWFIFAQVLGSLFIGCFDSTIMASSHPVITSHFGAAHSASWLSTTFLLASTAFQPLLGRLSDSLGRKPLFIGGVGLLALGTAWCGLAPSLGSFIAARALCGLGAGGSIALGSIMISDLVPIE